jgi:hypothetical protein
MRKRVRYNKFNILRVITGVYKMRNSVKYDTLIAVLSSVLHHTRHCGFYHVCT